MTLCNAVKGSYLAFVIIIAGGGNAAEQRAKYISDDDHTFHTVLGLS